MHCSVCGEVAILPLIGTDPFDESWPNLASECPGPEGELVPLRAGEDAVEVPGSAAADRGDALAAGDDGDAANAAPTVAAGADAVGLPDVEFRPAAPVDYVGRPVTVADALDVLAGAVGAERRPAFFRGLAHVALLRSAEIRLMHGSIPYGQTLDDGNGSAPTDDKAHHENAGGNAHPRILRQLRQPFELADGTRLAGRVTCRTASYAVTHSVEDRCDLEHDADREALLALRADVADVLAVVGRITNDVARRALCEAIARSIEVAS